MNTTKIETLYEKLKEHETNSQLSQSLDIVHNLLLYSPNEPELLVKKISYSCELDINIELNYMLQVCNMVKLNADQYYYMALKIFSLDDVATAITALASSLSIKETPRAREALNYALSRLGFKKLSIYMLTTTKQVFFCKFSFIPCCI
jgi:hypothetical protein